MEKKLCKNGEPDKINSDRFYVTDSDEIDLVDLWRILVRQRWLIMATTLLFTVGAIATVLFLPREYRAEVLMLPPLAENTEKLNVLNIMSGTDSNNSIDGATGQYFFQVDPNNLYNNLVINLQSSRLQRRFFDDNGIVRIVASRSDNRPNEQIFQENFRKKLLVKDLKKGNEKREFVSITLQGKNPRKLADWLNSFVHLVDTETVAAKTQLFANKVKRLKDSVRHRIASLRTTEKARRLDRIAKLEEAVKVAAQLGWVKRPENVGGLYEQLNNDRTNMSFSLQDMPLYLRGVKALLAEIKVLKQRTNDDPFIPDLRGLQGYQDFLSSIKQDTVDVHAMQIDEPAIADDRPVKPKRKLIVVLGSMFGFMIGVLGAFFRNRITLEMEEDA